MNSYYLHSINKAIDYIENNFDKKIKLEDVASISNFSKYHFHRIFKSIVNETLNDYIKRIRLEKAIRQLMSLPEKAIKDIAMDCGYDNPANFSRDFQNKYNKTPLQVREDKKIPPMGISTDKNLPPIELSEVKFIPSKKLVYKRISDGYNSHTIRPAFEELYYF
ncbi:MAG: AraC family transcriptional regulator, partial [Bacteroidales bacterium]|nr:AraC family transcriptional regulator [Bacteroidales bacterium]